MSKLANCTECDQNFTTGGVTKGLQDGLFQFENFKFLDFHIDVYTAEYFMELVWFNSISTVGYLMSNPYIYIYIYIYMIRFVLVLCHIKHCRLFHVKTSSYIYIKYIWFGLVWFGSVLQHINQCRLFIFTKPSARAGYDTRSIFKRSLTGLNSDFSFT